MFQRLLPFLLLLFFIGAKAPDAKTQVIDTLVLHFETDSDLLDQTACDNLEVFLNSYRTDGDLSIRINGHTDVRGSDGYNFDLAQRRCQSVRQVVEEHGFPDNALATAAFGEYRIAAEGKSEKDHQLNRRVEVIVDRHYFNNTAELKSALVPDEIQRYMLAGDEENTLYGDRGIVMRIPENAFLSADGTTYTGDVVLELEEAFDPLKFIASDLSTLNEEGQILRSGGMFRIDARDNEGNSLALDSTRAIEVNVPAYTRADGMNVYRSGNGEHWSRTTEPAGLLQRPAYPYAPEFPAELAFGYPKEPKIPEPPRKPAVPVKPVEPIISSQTDTSPESFGLFDRIFRARMVKAAQQSKEDVGALKKQERYHRALEVYERDSISYPDRLAQYKVDSTAWVQLKSDSMNHYYKVTVPEAYDKWVKFSASIREAYKKDFAAWRVVCDSLRTDYYQSLLNAGRMDSDALGTYVLNVKSLGWCNIDRLEQYEYKQRIDLVVEVEDPDAEIWFVLDDAPSMFRMKNENGVARRNDIPFVPSEIVVFHVKDGEVMLGRSPVRRTGEVKVKSYVSDLNEVREVLSGLADNGFQAMR